MPEGCDFPAKHKLNKEIREIHDKNPIRISRIYTDAYIQAVISNITTSSSNIDYITREENNNTTDHGRKRKVITFAVLIIIAL